MEVIRASNVNDAYVRGLMLLRAKGVEQPSRAGDVLVFPSPVTTVYEWPQQRVLFDEKRDANPGLHLFEALWMLAGRNDATWLDLFVKDFSARFAEADGHQHGAYGFRWRNHFEGRIPGSLRLDQLDDCVKLLSANKGDRQAVIGMWDPTADLAVVVKDKPCNTHIYLRVRTEVEIIGASQVHGLCGSHLEPVDYLDITVCCRSNDAIWGAYGANAVHFSVLQEYLAARIGVKVGRYYQVSNNFHAYLNVLEKVGEPSLVDPYLSGIKITPIVEVPESFDEDLRAFFGNTDNVSYKNRFFPEVAVPLFLAFKLWRSKQYVKALDCVSRVPPEYDWQVATLKWMQRRLR